MASSFKIPKITFGMIVLNGEPFIKTQLKMLYPYAHEIIVVEGASPFAAASADHNGHSLDNTLEILSDQKKTNDPEQKIQIITAEDQGLPDGFWPGEKDQQSRAYASRATGDWLWQVDVDEFYPSQSMREIVCFLSKMNPSMVYFNLRMFMYHPQVEVWGVEPEYSRCQPVPRIFKWSSGFEYISHRPPTVVNQEGINLKTIDPLTAEETLRRGWEIWHYPFLFRSQFDQKVKYYENFPFRKGMTEWLDQAKIMKRRKFSILWEGLSWLRLSDIRGPNFILEFNNGEYDYVPPDYLQGFWYQLLDRILICYISILRFFRVDIFSNSWFKRSYKLEIRKTGEESNGDRIFRERLKKSVFYRWAKFMGFVGFDPF